VKKANGQIIAVNEVGSCMNLGRRQAHCSGRDA
jgi:hypothetical protein